MANLQKFAKGNVKGLSIHLDRKTTNHSNKEIDVTKSHLNYDLCTKDGDTNSRLNERLNQVHCLNRKDVKVCATWVVTLPESLKEKSADDQRIFFEKTYDFLTDRYGGEQNVLSANVHNDETTPHMHFAFVPVVWDEKKQYEKVSAKEILNRKELQTFHQDLDTFLKREIPRIYREGILNGQTVDVANVKELKQYGDEIKQEKKRLDVELNSIKQDIDGAKNELLALNKKVMTSDINIKAKYQTRTVEVATGEKNLFGIEKKELKKERTGNIVLAEIDFEKLMATAKDNERLRDQLAIYLQTDVMRRNERLLSDRERFKDLFRTERKEKEKLASENQELKREVKQLNVEVKALTIEIRAAYAGVKEFVNEYIKAEQVKDVFQLVVEKITRKSRKERESVFENPKGKFERLDDQEKENDRQRSRRARSRGLDMER